eukprot:349629-Chlamydomonas_euryale.AAC.2
MAALHWPGPARPRSHMPTDPHSQALFSRPLLAPHAFTPHTSATPAMCCARHAPASCSPPCAAPRAPRRPTSKSSS